MSRFITSIPLDTSKLVKALPDKATVHEMRWNKAAGLIEMVWEDETLHSGLTVPIDFPLEMVKSRKLPKGVKVLPPRDLTPDKPKPNMPAGSKVNPLAHRASAPPPPDSGPESTRISVDPDRQAGVKKGQDESATQNQGLAGGAQEEPGGAGQPA